MMYARSDDLQRFVLAQDPVIAAARSELARGEKRSHWMWFLFPQLRGLGQSETSRYYGITSLDETRRYLQHPTLGPRLIECTTLVLQQPPERTAADIFGYPDDIKFRSSMTLFAHAAGGPSCYQAALDRFFAGQPDPLTQARLTAGR